MSDLLSPKERPILFSAPMVRAILDGRKTQTRRVVRQTASGTVKEPNGHRRWHPADPDAVAACPYGSPGDRLWVRETWGSLGYGREFGVELHYRADGDDWQENRDQRRRVIDPCPDRDGRFRREPLRWRPSIHMPRWASRITLEVTDVRIERLRDISEEDAVAEGAPSADLASGRECLLPHQGTHRWGFQLLWQQINGLQSWDANPWVWVVSFRRLQP